MYCQNCGAKRADGSVVCQLCGPAAMANSAMHGAKPASSGVRFANMLVDKIAAFAIGIIIVAVASLAFHRHEHMRSSHPGLGLVVMLAYLAYYFIFEACCQRTLGKLITGTKVVRMDGGKPTLAQTLGRTFARIIPFEAFSFFGLNTIGWHDRFSCTLVVPAGMTAEQVRSIDVAKYKKTNTLAAVIAIVLTGFLMICMLGAGIAAAMFASRMDTWNGNDMYPDSYQSQGDQSDAGSYDDNGNYMPDTNMNGTSAMGDSGMTNGAQQ